eukprot:CAMPEP_0194049396 /NCGR_PEP_ID=MMETSP0009_2-20130614/30616_1 /TAXON_ID=210454 /ORGANISM="Grammatophora oceanica, Strain CCMP 410" /LENGTH=233 /DNA_ID=CAMNT_0038695543 /DNA_START=55 /DNA_END=756 /DNA_ORIENTATION=+
MVDTATVGSSAGELPFWVDAAGALAPLAGILVFLAPIPTMRGIARDKTTGTLPLLPYSSMIGNCILWVTYGILKQQSKIWSCNVVGLVLGTWYWFQFIKYAPKNNLGKASLPGTVTQHVQAMGAIAAATMILAFFIQDGADLVGNMGVVLCVAMFASPLAALRTVIETRSAKSIPLPFTLASILNCFLWSTVGLLDMHDVNVIVPNLLGLFFGVVQVLLKFIYRNGASTELPI